MAVFSVLFCCASVVFLQYVVVLCVVVCVRAGGVRSFWMTADAMPVRVFFSAEGAKESSW